MAAPVRRFFRASNREFGAESLAAITDWEEEFLW
jgi:hypothetical protein